MARAKIMPLSAGDKTQVLGKLQGIPHFEKTLTASQCTEKGLTVPAWFVEKHGDRIRKSSILRRELSTKAWPVELSISVFTPTCSQVRFRGGWKAFAASNGLLEGDSLVFALKELSEFEVYVFRSDLPSRQWSSHSDGSAPKQSHKSRDGSLIAKRRTVIHNSASPPSNLQNSESMHLPPHFWKSLTATNVRVNVGCLEIPGDFWKTHGSRVQSEVKLQGIRDQSPVRTMARYTKYAKGTRHYLRGGWRAFVAENHLQVGNLLLFTLVADSFFVVREVLTRDDSDS